MIKNPYAQGHTVAGPKVPVNADIPNGLTLGKQISIKGTILPKCADFRVDLLTPQNFIALHINPRFNQNAIVRNTDRGGWGAEERDGKFPFKQGQPFELVITVQADQYKVSVNGEHSFDYRHRLPFQEVTKLAISGQIEVRTLSYVGTDIPKGQVNNPAVPSSVPIVGGLSQGRLIQISGQVPNNATRFTINLQAGPGVQARDIGLHFNPRWDGGPQPIVVRNTLRNGAWGAEERDHPAFPFTRGGAFDLLILCDATEYKVAVNGQHFISYQHQIPFKFIDHIGFDGSVVINAVRQFN